MLLKSDFFSLFALFGLLLSLGVIFAEMVLDSSLLFASSALG